MKACSGVTESSRCMRGGAVKASWPERLAVPPCQGGAVRRWEEFMGSIADQGSEAVEANLPPVRAELRALVLASVT